MLGNHVISSVRVFEEHLNRLKWWTMCTPLMKLVTEDWQATRVLAPGVVD